MKTLSNKSSCTNWLKYANHLQSATDIYGMTFNCILQIRKSTSGYENADNPRYVNTIEKCMRFAFTLDKNRKY